MRGLSVRSVASSALCATVALGLAAPAALAADISPEGRRAASRAPAADTDPLVDLNALLKPVNDLLASVLTPDTQLGADEVEDINDVVQEALADIQDDLPAATSTSTSTSTSTVTTTPTTPATPSTAATPSASATTTTGATDAALAALQKSVDELVKATTSLNSAQAGTAADGLKTSLVNLVNATLKDIGASTSSALTSLPTTASTLPAALPTTLPAALPATPAPSAS